MSIGSNELTLEDVEQLVNQLPPPAQLKLAARICERLSNGTAPADQGVKPFPTRLEDVEAWLAACDAFVESQPDRPRDVADELRRIREERANRL